MPSTELATSHEPRARGCALDLLLDELDTVLHRLPHDIYRTRVLTGVSGSIGEHVRHCLDHMWALVTADSGLPLSYDRRQRGTAVETDIGEARRHIGLLKVALARWSARALGEPILVSSMQSPVGEAVESWSTLGRELAFVINHTIHHQALIAVLLAIQGQAVPPRFGHSPATPAPN